MNKLGSIQGRAVLAAPVTPGGSAAHGSLTNSLTNHLMGGARGKSQTANQRTQRHMAVWHPNQGRVLRLPRARAAPAQARGPFLSATLPVPPISRPPPCSRPRVSVAPPAHTVSIAGCAAGTQPWAIWLLAATANSVRPLWPLLYAGPQPMLWGRGPTRPSTRHPDRG